MNKLITLKEVLTPPVHVIISVDYNLLDYDSFHAVLDDHEQERAARCKVENGRKLLVFAHGLKRFLLGRFLDIPPASLSFGKNKNGKPHSLAQAAPHFNISHSGNHIVLGLSSHGEMGVDIEFPANFSFRNIETAVLSKEELAKLPKHAEWEDFLYYWTQKEAIGKACSLGLGIDFPTITVSGQPGPQEILFEKVNYHLQSFPHDNNGILSVASTTKEPFPLYSLQDWESGQLLQLSP